MKKRLTPHLIAASLFSMLMLAFLSCDEASQQFEKSKVQFSLSPATTSHSQGRINNGDLPENARLLVSIESRSGAPVLTNHEIQVRKGETYMTEPLDLLPGNYVITDFMIIDGEEVLNATPKMQSPLSEYVTHSLPYNFSVAQSGLARVNMQVIDARKQKPEAFGYASFKIKRANTLSFMVTKPRGGQPSLRGAVAELRKGKEVIKTFPVRHGVNQVTFEGAADAMYTLSVYADVAAKVKTFNLKALKKELGARPLRLELEPAFMLTVESSVDEGNEYEESFEFALEGSGGEVNVNWGDGYESSGTLPFMTDHEYTTGTYTAVITGDLDQITTFHGFSYSTIIYEIEGLTNLTGLRTYNPSWGAVPLKVDLSNCQQLETIFVEKYGAPYEPIDLLKDFKLPEQHFIREFVLEVPSLDANRGSVSTAELDMMVNNIYNNVTKRGIRGGKFFVHPIDGPSPEAQQKLDILQNEYDWIVRFDGNIWDDYSEYGRTAVDLDTRRENWLRQKFPNTKRKSSNPKMAFID